MTGPTTHARFTPPVLLLGVGNDLRGDDAAGWRVVDAVGEWNRPGVTTLRVRQLAPEHVEEMADAATVVVIDAAVSDRDTLEIQRVAPDASHGPLSHSASPARLLRLVHQLHGRSPDCWLLAIPAEQFDLGGELSPGCQAGIEAAAKWLLSRVPVE